MNIADLTNHLESIFNPIDLTTIMNHPWPILVYLFIALIVTQIPFLGGYFSLYNTLIHEVIRVIFTGGRANKINLPGDGSGWMLNRENSRFKYTLITYAGYTAESLAAIGLFYLVANQSYQVILYLLIGFIAAAGLLWIRNFWGIIWALTFVVLLALPMYFHQPIALMHISIFLASFLLIQSVLNGIQACRQSLFERKNPSSGFGLLDRVKRIPSMLLGVVPLGQALYTGYFVVMNILSLS